MPAPHSDGVFRVHSHRQQQLPRGAEIHVADAFSVRRAEDGQRLFTHGVPHVDGGSRSCRDTREDVNPGLMWSQGQQRVPELAGGRRAGRGINAAYKHPENRTDGRDGRRQNTFFLQSAVSAALI